MAEGLEPRPRQALWQVLPLAAQPGLQPSLRARRLKACPEAVEQSLAMSLAE